MVVGRRSPTYDRVTTMNTDMKKIYVCIIFVIIAGVFIISLLMTDKRIEVDAPQKPVNIISTRFSDITIIRQHIDANRRLLSVITSDRERGFIEKQNEVLINECHMMIIKYNMETIELDDKTC